MYSGEAEDRWKHLIIRGKAEMNMYFQPFNVLSQ